MGLLVSSLTIQSQECLEMIEEKNFTVQEIIDNAETYFETKDKGRGSGYVQFKRWEYNATRLMNENGILSTITETLTEVENFNRKNSPRLCLGGQKGKFENLRFSSN